MLEPVTEILQQSILWWKREEPQYSRHLSRSDRQLTGKRSISPLHQTHLYLLAGDTATN